jgi:DNA-directed RNA polymerase subunit L|tara:strand:+ start:57388 stop:57651 length:264 start_codon:yes stop_codon:yes gene_type:complete
MDIEIVKDEKNEIEVKIENLTIAEILRVYLNEDPSVKFAAWKRKHQTESPTLKVQTEGKTAKKAVGDAVVAITKELDRVSGDFAKLK